MTNSKPELPHLYPAIYLNFHEFTEHRGIREQTLS
jgi:hypothetical protein